jgi:DNA-binding transcriptional regulator YiaG
MPGSRSPPSNSLSALLDRGIESFANGVRHAWDGKKIKRLLDGAPILFTNQDGRSELSLYSDRPMRVANFLDQAHKIPNSGPGLYYSHVFTTYFTCAFWLKSCVHGQDVPREGADVRPAGEKGQAGVPVHGHGTAGGEREVRIEAPQAKVVAALQHRVDPPPWISTKLSAYTSSAERFTGSRVREFNRSRRADPPLERFTAADVRALRERLGLTREGFARYLEVSQATLSAWERAPSALRPRARTRAALQRSWRKAARARSG